MNSILSLKRFLPSRVLRVAVSLSSTQFLGSAIRFVYLVIIARMLPVNEVGIYTFGVAFYLALLGLVAFGQNILLSTRAGKRRASLLIVVPHSLTITLALIVLTATGGFIFLLVDPPPSIEAQAYSFFLLSLIARGINSWVRMCFISLEETGWIPRYEFLFRGGEAVAGSIALLAGSGLVALCFLHFLFWTIEAIASLRLFVSRSGIPLKFGRNKRMLARIVKISVVYALGFWMFHVFAQVGILTLKIVQSDTEMVAQFAIAMQLLIVLSIIPGSLGQAIIPGLSRARQLRSAADVRAVATAIKASLIGGVLIAILAGLFGPWFIAFLFGEQYSMAGSNFTVLSWMFGPYAAAFIALQALNALGARHLATLMAALMVGSYLVTMPFLIPLGAVQAVIVALVLCSAAGSVLGAIFLTSRIGTFGFGWWLRPVLVAVACGVAFNFVGLDRDWLAMALIVFLALSTWGLRIFTLEEFVTIRRKFEMGPIQSSGAGD